MATKIILIREVSTGKLKGWVNELEVKDVVYTITGSGILTLRATGVYKTKEPRKILVHTSNFELLEARDE